MLFNRKQEKTKIYLPNLLKFKISLKMTDL